MFIKVGAKGVIINTDRVTYIKHYNDMWRLFLDNGRDVALLPKDYEYFNSIAMVPGEGKSQGKWCDPVVRDEAESPAKRLAKMVMSWREDGTSCRACDARIEYCTCEFREVHKQAQSILEQSP